MISLAIHFNANLLIVLLLFCFFLLFSFILSVKQYRAWKRLKRRGVMWDFKEFYFLGNNLGLVLLVMVIITMALFGFSFIGLYLYL